MSLQRVSGTARKPINEQPFWLTNAQMARLEPFFSKSYGKPCVDDGRVMSGIIFINRNGLRWCDAPTEYGPPKSLYYRWRRRSDKGIFARMMEGPTSEAAVPTTVRINATYLKAHRTATSLRTKWGVRRPARPSDRAHEGPHEHQTELMRVYRGAKLSENCTLWNMHKRRRPRSHLHPLPGNVYLHA